MRAPSAVVGLILSCLAQVVFGVHPLTVYDQIQQHPKGCQPGQIWLSTQSWWSATPATNTSATKDQGHLHHEHCWNWMKPVPGG